MKLHLYKPSNSETVDISALKYVYEIVSVATTFWETGSIGIKNDPDVH